MEPARDEHSDPHSPGTGDPGTDDLGTGDLGPEPTTGAASLPSVFDSIVDALLDAGPEVADHVVNAARELLLAAEALVDATARVVREQQQVREARAGEGAGGPSNVHHLDRTE